MRSIDNKHSFVDRDLAGFLFGGVLAAVAVGSVFVAVFPIPKEPDPRDHKVEALFITAIVAIVMFLCGGFITLNWLASMSLGATFALVPTGGSPRTHVEAGGVTRQLEVGPRFRVELPLRATGFGYYDFGSDGFVTSHAVTLWTDSGTSIHSVVVSFSSQFR